MSIETYTAEMNIRYQIRNWFKENYDINKLAYFLSSLSLEGAMNMQKKAEGWFTLNNFYKEGDRVSFSYTKGTTMKTAEYECNLGGYPGEVWETSFDEFQKEPEHHIYDEQTGEWFSELATDNIIYSFDDSSPSQICWVLVYSNQYNLPT